MVLMASLILVRHGESEWNSLGKIAGLADISLTEDGKAQARQAGLLLQNKIIDIAFVSELNRAQQTLAEIRLVHKTVIPLMKSAALNERDFGDFTGKEKKALIEELGTEVYTSTLKAWDVRAPSGESLRMVYDRVVSFFEANVLPEINKGKTILLVSHHHTLRALTKYLEHISDADIVSLSVENADPVTYVLEEASHSLRRKY